MNVPTLAVGKAGSIAVLALCAVLEVLGDAIIRKGLRGSGLLVAALGAAVLASYGALANLLDIHFSRLLGTYVGLFAVVSVLFGRLLFEDQISPSTWIGLVVILGGSLIVQLG
ncbi:MAG TPA: hypothetical protein VLV17_07165 [Anaeromyxobacteraceae bacterium]|nr:hypothetical protein [Anaeromyxobacteraceae bacterium]